MYELSGYLHRILCLLVGHMSTYVKDSTHFIELLRGVTIDDDEVMVSFDVKSMFTCVPVDYAVRCCKDLLENNASLPSRSPFETKGLCRLLEFCLTNAYFVLSGQFHKQWFGTAMGASVFVVCANIALDALENSALCSYKMAPKLFVRSVDVCFCVIRHQDVMPFLEHLTSLFQASSSQWNTKIMDRLPSSTSL